MPYVITVTPRPTHDQLVARIDGVELPATRTAVATLEEARRECRRILAELGIWPTDAVDALPANGGTIALPDGTVIEVADRIENDLEARGSIRDANGNTVGTFSAES